MAITGRDPDECFEQFREHVSMVLSRTLTDRHPITIIRSDRDNGLMSFRQGNRPFGVPLDTSYGNLKLYVWHNLRVRKGDGEHQLTTRSYRYWLMADLPAGEQPVIRWEYEPETTDTQPVYHVQLRATLKTPGGDIDLDKVHTATGRVLIEDVIRFLIRDLGFEPPCGPKDWNAILLDSERKFYDEFSPRAAPRRGPDEP